MWQIGRCYEVHSCRDNKVYRFKVKNFFQKIGSDHFEGCLEGTSEVISLDFITHYSYFYIKGIACDSFGC
jgi:hypothetical protein